MRTNDLNDRLFFNNVPVANKELLSNHDGDGSKNGKKRSENNAFPRAFDILVHFFAVLCKTATPEDHVRRT